jgi:hypothetical protein
MIREFQDEIARLKAQLENFSGGKLNFDGIKIGADGQQIVEVEKVEKYVNNERMK